MGITREELESLVQCWSHQVFDPSETLPHHMVIVALHLESGVVVNGESVCRQRESYNVETGIRLATDKAYRNLARLMEFHMAMMAWRGGAEKLA